MIVFIETYATLIVVVMAAITALFGAWRKVTRPLKAIADIVQVQLTPNGGGSLVDKVGQIAPNHVEAKMHWEGLEAAHKLIVKRLEKIEAQTATPKDVP